MEIDHPVLFIEINNTNYVFVAGVYDENQKLKVIEKIITPNAGIEKNKLTNIIEASDVIKKNIGNKTYELKKRGYTHVLSYEIENISHAILNNFKEVSFPGMSLEETLLNTKILEEWFNA